MALVNVWHHRKVAEASAKSCDICFKPTTSVLITPDNKDHFYVCPGHLKDKGFCSPVIDQEEAAAKKKEEIDREIKIIQQEYEEKLKKKQKVKEQKDREKKSEKDKEKEKDKPEDKKDEDKETIEKEKDAKIKAISNGNPSSMTDDTPRIYALQKVFYQKRLDRLRGAEIAKRNRERLKSPNLFPSVPTGNLA